MTEWILHAPDWTRSLEYTSRETRCGRFVLRAWSFGGGLKWVLTVGDEIHSTHHTVFSAYREVEKILSLEAAS